MPEGSSRCIGSPAGFHSPPGIDRPSDGGRAVRDLNGVAGLHLYPWAAPAASLTYAMVPVP